ncbi:MAG: hydrogenase maturation protease [Gemmatimonadota bacterium]
MRLRRGGLSSDPAEVVGSDGGPPRTYVAGVGYTHLKDYSVGPLVLERLEVRASEEEWPEAVMLGDLSYDPVKIVHWLNAEDPPFERLILISAAARGRAPGEVTAYRWDQNLPDPEQIQTRVAEAVTGVIDIDNLLVVMCAFGAAPPEICIVEIEPVLEEMGEELSPEVAKGAREAEEIVRNIALGSSDPSPLPTGPLGGFGSGN